MAKVVLKIDSVVFHLNHGVCRVT